MSNTDGKIKYEIIEAAVTGDAIAIEKVMDYFERYIFKLSMTRVLNENGEESYYADPYLVSVLRNHLIDGVMKFKLE